MNKTLIFTGGHHTSSLAVAESLLSSGWNIVWFGHRYSMWADSSDSAEYKEVTAAGIKFIDLKAGKFYRTFHPLKLIRIPYGFIQAFFTVLKLKLDRKNPLRGIVSFGGYLAVPTVFCGWILHVPAITHEQTVIAGWANKFICIFAKKIAISWPDNKNHYPKSKTIYTGLPLRPEILEIAANNKPTKQNSKPVLYVTGGKQGSHILNQLIFNLLPKLTQDFMVIHQTGSSTLFHDDQTATKLTGPNYSCFAYDRTLATTALKNADLVISRAGAHTIYELAVLGKKCVLVPLPYSSHSEQLLNAMFLESQGLAVVLLQKDLNNESLTSAIESAQLLKPKPLDLPLDATTKIVELINSTLI